MGQALVDKLVIFRWQQKSIFDNIDKAANCVTGKIFEISSKPWIVKLYLWLTPYSALNLDKSEKNVWQKYLHLVRLRLFSRQSQGGTSIANHSPRGIISKLGSFSRPYLINTCPKKEFSQNLSRSLAYVIGNQT